MYTKDVSNYISGQCVIFEVWWKLLLCNAPLCSILEGGKWWLGSNLEHVDIYCELV